MPLGSFLVFHPITPHLPHLVSSSAHLGPGANPPPKTMGGGGPPATNHFLKALHIAGLWEGGGRKGTSLEIKSDY